MIIITILLLLININIAQHGMQHTSIYAHQARDYKSMTKQRWEQEWATYIAQHGMQHQPEHKAHGISQPSETTKSSRGTTNQRSISAKTGKEMVLFMEMQHHIKTQLGIWEIEHQLKCNCLQKFFCFSKELTTKK